MKSFLVSFLCLLLLLTVWGFYSNYSDKEIHAFINDIEHGILIDVQTENWQQAGNKFEQFEDEWHRYKKLSSLFFHTDKINDADYSIARAKYYIKAEDISNSAGELSCLQEQLKYLHENESVTLYNIF